MSPSATHHPRPHMANPVPDASPPTTPPRPPPIQVDVLEVQVETPHNHQPVSFADRLIGATAGGVGGFAAQWNWAASETHYMFFDWTCRICRMRGVDSLACSRDWRAYSWTVVRNPVYWVFWIPTAIAVLLGRRMHQCVNQHGTLSEHETHAEHEIRCWWAYPSDAAFAAGLLLLALDIVLYSAQGELGDLRHWSRLLVGVVVYICYGSSNVVFLASIRRRSQLHVRACIAGIAALAVCLIALFITTVYREATGQIPNRHLWYEVYTWGIRVIVTVFIVAQAYTYARVWNTYGGNTADWLQSQGLAGPAHRSVSSVTLPSELSPPGGNGKLAEDSNPRLSPGAEDCREPRHPSVSSGGEGRTSVNVFCSRNNCLSLLAAFSTSLVVACLLISAFFLNYEALWQALAGNR